MEILPEAWVKELGVLAQKPLRPLFICQIVRLHGVRRLTIEVLV